MIIIMKMMDFCDNGDDANGVKRETKKLFMITVTLMMMEVMPMTLIMMVLMLMVCWLKVPTPFRISMKYALAGCVTALRIYYGVYYQVVARGTRSTVHIYTCIYMLF